MYERINKKAKSCMFVASLIAFVIITIVLVVGYVIANRYVDNYVSKIIKIAIAIILGLDLVNVLIGPSIRYRRYKYLINTEKIDVVEGFIFIERNIVPINRIHNIAINQGPIDRIFKLAKVEVITAGGSVDIRFLEEELAEKIADSLKDKINIICEEEKVIDHEVKDE